MPVASATAVAAASEKALKGALRDEHRGAASCRPESYDVAGGHRAFRTSEPACGSAAASGATRTPRSLMQTARRGQRGAWAVADIEGIKRSRFRLLMLLQ